MVELKEVLASDDDAMLLAFYNEMRAFFTDLPEDTVRAVAAEGMVRLGWFVNEEMIEYLFGEAFRGEFVTYLLFISYKFVKGFLAITILLLVFSN